MNWVHWSLRECQFLEQWAQNEILNFTCYAKEVLIQLTVYLNIGLKSSECKQLPEATQNYVYNVRNYMT